MVVAPDLSCVVANCEEVLWIERVSIHSSHPAVVARFKDSKNQSWKQACRSEKRNEKRLSKRRKPEVPGLACILHERTLPWAVPTLKYDFFQSELWCISRKVLVGNQVHMIMFIVHHEFGGHSWLKGQAADSLPLVRVGHGLVSNDQPFPSGFPKVPDVPPPGNIL